MSLSEFQTILCCDFGRSESHNYQNFNTSHPVNPHFIISYNTVSHVLIFQSESTGYNPVQFSILDEIGFLTSGNSPLSLAKQLSSINSFTFFSICLTFSSGLLFRQANMYLGIILFY